VAVSNAALFGERHLANGRSYSTELIGQLGAKIVP
jgi:hypothetical protein